MKDYYKILGVDRQASTEQIKKAYRSLAKKYHPDVVKDDKAKQERMYEIQEAYACLENEERRKKYDAECLKSPRNTVNAGEKVKNGRTGSRAKTAPIGHKNRQKNRSRTHIPITIKISITAPARYFCSLKFPA